VADLNDFRRVADDVRNWGRWGDADELGTLNFITADKVAQAAGLVRHGKVFSLGVDFGSSGPQGAFKFRHNPIHVMTVDGGDARSLPRFGVGWDRNPGAKELGTYFQDELFRFNDDMVIMPLQAATQWDALSHVYYEDQLYNGFPATLSPVSVRCTAGSTKSTARGSPRVGSYWTSSVIAVCRHSWNSANRSPRPTSTTSPGRRASRSAAATSF
jgi:hypothetical protein